jgi:hypothetical protein
MRKVAVVAACAILLSACGPHRADDPRSQLIDVSMPYGSTVQRSDDGTLEVWLAPDGANAEVNRLHQVLPITAPLNGIAWCEGYWNEKFSSMTWTWADSTQWLVVHVAPYIPPKAAKGETGPGSEVTISYMQSDEGC